MEEGKITVRNVLWCAAAFTSYTFMSTLSAMEITGAAGRYCVNPHISVSYAMLLFSTAAGFILFGLLYKKWPTPGAYITPSACIVIISMLAVYFFPISSLIRIIMILCPLSTGVIGGSVYFQAAEILHKSKHLGLTIGGAYGTSVIIQFIVQTFAKSSVVHLILIIMTVCVIAIWEMRITDISGACDMDAAEDGITAADEGSVSKKNLWLLAVTVAAVALMTGIYDGLAAELEAVEKMNLAGWPRILLGLGTFAAGYLYDVWHRRYLNIAVLCVAIINTLNVLLLSSEHTYMLSQTLTYASMGFYIVYLMVSFMNAAPGSKEPALWAGAGRTSYLIAMSVTTPLATYFARSSNVAMYMIMMVLLIIVFLMFVMNGGLAVQKEKIESPKEISTEEKIKAFAQQYGLTPRENEVLAAVSSSERTLAAIASEMGISERVLQRHLSSIYKKTGTQTRNGLTLALHGAKRNK